jgi:hypothetical protein
MGWRRVDGKAHGMHGSIEIGMEAEWKRNGSGRQKRQKRLMVEAAGNLTGGGGIARPKDRPHHAATALAADSHSAPT